MNVHDNLGRYGAQASAGARARLESVEVRDALDARVRRGRRRRSVGGGLGAVAGVSLVAVGVWSVMPGMGGAFDPAASEEPAAAGPYRYVVDDVLDEHSVNDVPAQEPEVFLRGDGEVMCGDEVSLTPGVTIHHAEAIGRDLFFEAELVTLGDVSPFDPPATPEPIDPENPDGPWTGWDPAEPVWDGWVGGVMDRQVSTTLLMDGDTVVGVHEGSSMFGGLEGPIEGTSGGRVPSVGYCDLSDMTWEDLGELEPGDPMDTLLVAQFWGEVQDPGEGVAGDSVLLATIVVDPHQPANSSISPRDHLPEWEGSADGPQPAPEPVDQAELVPPDGDSYQAFVVPAPAVGCAPFADLLAAGQPSADSFSYAVDLPGVAESLDGELWGPEPVVTLPTDEDRWYSGADAWIVAEDVSAGIKDPPLIWDGTVLTAGFGGHDTVRSDDCAYVQPIPAISGAVFLVISGADIAAIEDAGVQVKADPEQMELYTWIYLGQAESSQP